MLFSAAIKHQGSVNHINEQWQSYWIEKYKNNGYACYDIIRPIIWKDDSIQWWYRQNIFVFVNSATDRTEFIKLRTVAIPDLVHPDNYEASKHEMTEAMARHDAFKRYI